MPKLSIEDLNLAGKHVLVRVDFNVPLKETGDGRFVVADNTRIRAALPTIKKIINENGKAILMSHLGRPKGSPDPKYSLAPIAEELGKLITMKVVFLEDTVGPDVIAAIQEAPSGSVILLENTRFLQGETKNDPELARQMAKLADVYISDAFGSVHRAHASTEGVAHHVAQAAMGYLLKKEVESLGSALGNPRRPFTAILGGAKVSDKIGVIEALLGKVDNLLIGGAMAYTFLKATGHTVGTSRIEQDKLDQARSLFESSEGRIHLPEDHVVAQAFDNDSPHQVVDTDIPDGYMGLDIGPGTTARYRDHLLNSSTIIWNGPMGVFEMSNYAKGTFAIAGSLADATDRGAMTIVGGGDSVAAIMESGFAYQVSHVSTGGGAMLELLEGKTLPGVAALTDK